MPKFRCFFKQITFVNADIEAANIEEAENMCNNWTLYPVFYSQLDDETHELDYIEEL